jgi:hypothetical protein
MLGGIINLHDEEVDARTLMLEDDFNLPDGSYPDRSNWTVFTQGAGDSVRIKGEAAFLSVENGGTATMMTRRQVETDRFTIEIMMKTSKLEGRPMVLEIRTLKDDTYAQWLKIFYDNTGGWTYSRMKDGTIDITQSNKRNLVADRWININVTFNRGSASIHVSDYSTGASVWTESSVDTDDLTLDNVIAFGVWGDSRESPLSSFDEFRLWDNRIPPNIPPGWGLLPTIDAIEDSPYDFDLSSYVHDPDDPVSSLRISSESEFLISTTGLMATFLFMDEISDAVVPLRLHDAESYSDALLRFTITPVNDPPHHSIPKKMSAQEDVPKVIDLSDLIWDDDNEKGDISIASGSPFATVEGLYLTLVFPNDVLTYHLSINISDGIDMIETHIAFTVIPVDDPPYVMGLDEFQATEDHLSVLDMSVFLFDEDTPLERLRLTVLHDRVQVVGLEVRFLFLVGGITDNVRMEVADTISVTIFHVLVTVMEVNDPPVVYVNRTYLLKENQTSSIDLSPHISDEDDESTNLSLICDHEAVISVTGLIISLRFEDSHPEHSLEFDVSDGKAKTRGTVLISVQDVNDPPTIHGLDGISPPITITLDEGTERWLTIDADDEEQELLMYSSAFHWRGVAVFQDGTLRISTLPGEVGTFEGTIHVDDGVGGISGLDFIIKINNVNDPPGTPIIILPSNRTSLAEGSNVTFRVDIIDPDVSLGQVLTVTWISNISGPISTLSESSKFFQTRYTLPPGVHKITVTVTDGEHIRSSWIEVTVLETFVPPDDGEQKKLMEPYHYRFHHRPGNRGHGSCSGKTARRYNHTSCRGRRCSDGQAT